MKPITPYFIEQYSIKSLKKIERQRQKRKSRILARIHFFNEFGRSTTELIKLKKFNGEIIQSIEKEIQKRNIKN